MILSWLLLLLLMLLLCSIIKSYNHANKLKKNLNFFFNPHFINSCNFIRQQESFFFLLTCINLNQTICMYVWRKSSGEKWSEFIHTCAWKKNFIYLFFLNRSCFQAIQFSLRKKNYKLFTTHMTRYNLYKKKEREWKKREIGRIIVVWRSKINEWTKLRRKKRCTIMM